MFSRYTLVDAGVEFKDERISLEHVVTGNWFKLNPKLNPKQTLKLNLKLNPKPHTLNPKP